VSISGDVAIVGAYGKDENNKTNAGVAYIFTREKSVWTQQQKLTAPDGAEGDEFGYSVSISGDAAIVGDFWEGAAYIY
jgi:hypothetical protein